MSAIDALCDSAAALMLIAEGMALAFFIVLGLLPIVVFGEGLIKFYRGWVEWDPEEGDGA